MAAGKRIVNTTEAPAPVGPYSQAVWAGDMLFLSGQIALDPATGELVTGDVEKETERVLENLGSVLRAAGLDYSNVVKVTIFLRSMEDFSRVNGVYARYFGDNPPARACVEVSALPKGVSVEMEAVAVR